MPLPSPPRDDTTPPRDEPLSGSGSGSAAPPPTSAAEPASAFLPPPQAAEITEDAPATTPLTLPLPEDLHRRLEALAARSGRGVEDCAVQAVAEYLDSWEDYHRAVDTLTKGERRPVLKAINE